MKLTEIFNKPASEVRWQPGMTLYHGMRVQCHGEELFAVIKAGMETGLEVTALLSPRGGRKSEWVATLSAKSPDKNNG